MQSVIVLSSQFHSLLPHSLSCTVFLALAFPNSALAFLSISIRPLHPLDGASFFALRPSLPRRAPSRGAISCDFRTTRRLVGLKNVSLPRGLRRCRLVGPNSYLFSFSGLSFGLSFFLLRHFFHRRSLRRLSLLRDVPRQHPPLLHEVSVKVDRAAVAALLAAGGRIVILRDLQPSQPVIVLSLLLV